MTPERYQKLLHWMEAHPAVRTAVIALNRWLPAVPFVCYPLLLVLLNVQWFRLLQVGLNQTALDFMQLIARAILVPGFVFFGGTVLRAKLNFPRPYEQPGFTPLVEKETHGHFLPLPPCPERGGAGNGLALLLSRRRGRHGGRGRRHLRAAGAGRGPLPAGCPRRGSSRFCTWLCRNVDFLTASCPARRKNFKKIGIFA